MDPIFLRDLIWYRLQDGRLPRNHMIELGHGHGVGHVCDGCGSSIAWNQRMTVRMCSDDWRTIRLHDDCFQIWDTERRMDLREVWPRG